MAKKKSTPKNEQAAGDEDLTTEQKKASGQTESQQQLREYHEGEFQKADPITGEARDLDKKPRIARLDRGETIDDLDDEQ